MVEADKTGRASKYSAGIGYSDRQKISMISRLVTNDEYLRNHL